MSGVCHTQSRCALFAGTNTTRSVEAPRRAGRVGMVFAHSVASHFKETALLHVFVAANASMNPGAGPVNQQHLRTIVGANRAHTISGIVANTGVSKIENGEQPFLNVIPGRARNADRKAVDYRQTISSRSAHIQNSAMTLTMGERSVLSATRKLRRSDGVHTGLKSVRSPNEIAAKRMSQEVLPLC